MKENCIVLCGTNPHIELIKQLKKDYYVILVDYAENPPAKSYADLHLIENAFDANVVESIGRKYSVKLIISVAAEYANCIATEVSEKLGLFVPYSSAIAYSITNKDMMKKIMTKWNIPTANYIEVSNIENDTQFLHDINYPSVVKPIDNYGSKGVLKVTNSSQLDSAMNYSMKFSKAKKIIVEEYVKGDEYSIYGFIQNGKYQTVAVAEKIAINNQEGVVIQNIGTMQPANISKSILDKIADIGQKITDAYSFQNTALMIQAIITGDNINVIEYSPRLGGGLSFRTIKTIFDVDLIELSIKAFQNKKVSLIVKDSGKMSAIINIYGKKGIFGSITGLEELKNEETIKEYFYRKNSGAEIIGDLNSRDRVAQIIIIEDSYKKVFNSIKQAINKIGIWSISGDDMRVHNLYSPFMDR